jgi:hypothetical protein
MALALEVKAAVMTKHGSDRPLVGTNRALLGSVCNLVATTVAEP